MWPAASPVCFVNARVAAPDGIASTLRFSSKVLGVDMPPRRGDVVVDLEGSFVLPGLINAHDHLELNHYGPLKGREHYENASAWVDDMRPRLKSDPTIVANRRHPLASRLFIGGLKNLLSGVTTVAHHNPRYREIERSVPIRVVRRYGWAHSFLLERQPVGARGEPGGEVRARYRATPPTAPFMIHVGEGLDQAAADEVGRLESMGCLAGNTVMVHGVTVNPVEWTRVVARGGSLVWCPASNRFLFGRTVRIRQLLDVSDQSRFHVCLGSDSRITGSRDLLDELREAAAASGIESRELLRMVTTTPARVLRLPDAGAIVRGASADLVVVPATKTRAADSLLDASRKDIRLVTLNGKPLVAASSLRAVFQARRARACAIAVDGVERLADRRLANAIDECPIREPGVECL